MSLHFSVCISQSQVIFFCRLVDSPILSNSCFDVYPDFTFIVGAIKSARHDPEYTWFEIPVGANTIDGTTSYLGSIGANTIEGATSYLGGISYLKPESIAHTDKRKE